MIDSNKALWLGDYSLGVRLDDQRIADSVCERNPDVLHKELLKAPQYKPRRKA